MTRLVTLGPAALVVWMAAAGPVAAQVQRTWQPVTQLAEVAQADLRGLVVDDRGHPVTGAVLSALGSTTAFAVSDAQGRFAFRNLPPGAYLLRAHLQGYVPPRARVVQVSSRERSASTITLVRRDRDDDPPVLAAGVGTSGVDLPAEPEPHDHGETAWRLRHMKRSVLKEAALQPYVAEDSGLLPTSLSELTRTVALPARMATALFAGVPFTGQVNLLTTTSLDRPQDLFTAEGLAPHGVAYVALSAPTTGGAWNVTSALTQGDLTSWIVAGSYRRAGEADHRYEAGLSYGTQRYPAGRIEALAVLTDGSRSVGSVYGFDRWTVHPQVTVEYGAKYDRYDYLTDRGLLSPRASVAIRPSIADSLELRAAASHREVAPGAEEFLPPSTGLWLPPERTFSPLERRAALNAQSIDHAEVAAERVWAGDFVLGVRAFRQSVDNQLVAVFGVPAPAAAPATVAHYRVASAGAVDAAGWGVSISRDMTDGLRASIDYTQTRADWRETSPDAGALARTAASALRAGRERLHDLTANVETTLPATATRVFVIYKLNNGFAAGDTPGTAGPDARFHVQVNQSLPFMNFSGAHWELLLSIRNLFREDLLDSSVYEELLVVQAPTRVVGGLSVRF